MRQAFVVDPKLETLYYSLYDPRVVVESMKHHTIIVRREELEEDIEAQKQMVRSQAELARVVAALIAKIK